MASNRRNYYRLLHVQPDAPPEVIRASYRALMALHHPDVGGDHATAALINEAYIRLVGQQRMTWRNRAQFLGIAAQFMRRDFGQKPANRNRRIERLTGGRV